MASITTTDATDIFDEDWGAGQPVVLSHGRTEATTGRAVRELGTEDR
ncbi:hypothetical protein [Blastococcus xanthinilyticus]|uniref:Uncharacterized protein n=1 Tax=Blastococcus xanthinilyticus TaxID=1564164 RepID=A0A5S5D0L4_9ACTN|nr:hypothetical protein [Blastococcus xanthinilyticus]TYP88332.1 hypothetical protein BD833_10435 [Blastococcus xanthinilyticus]